MQIIKPKIINGQIINGRAICEREMRYEIDPEFSLRWSSRALLSEPVERRKEVVGFRKMLLSKLRDAKKKSSSLL